MASARELNAAIIYKFGSLRKFASLTGQSYEKVRKAVSKTTVDVRRDDYMKLVMNTDNVDVIDVFTESNMEVLKASIVTAYGSITAMSETHKDWSRSSLNDLVNGRRKTVTDRFKSLISHLIEVIGEKDGNPELLEKLNIILEQTKQ